MDKMMDDFGHIVSCSLKVFLIAVVAVPLQNKYRTVTMTAEIGMGCHCKIM